MMRKLLMATVISLSIPVVLFLTVWLYPRPVDTTPAWVFDSDGSELNYCELPDLDGSGLMASDIPRAYTPGCGYTQYPQPILRGCTEPLPEGSQDIRGLWASVDPRLPNHVERVEQDLLLGHRAQAPRLVRVGSASAGRCSSTPRISRRHAS